MAEGPVATSDRYATQLTRVSFGPVGIRLPDMGMFLEPLRYDGKQTFEVMCQRLLIGQATQMVSMMPRVEDNQEVNRQQEQAQPPAPTSVGSKSLPVYHVEGTPSADIENGYPTSSDEEQHWGVTVYSNLKSNDTVEKLQDIINNLHDKCRLYFDVHPAKESIKTKPSEAVLEIYFETPVTNLIEEKPTQAAKVTPIKTFAKEVIVKKPVTGIPTTASTISTPPGIAVIEKGTVPEEHFVNTEEEIIEKRPIPAPTKTESTTENPTTTSKEPHATQSAVEKPTNITKATHFVTPKKKRIKEKPTRESKPETSEKQTTEKTTKAMRIITRKKIPIEEKPTRESKPETSETQTTEKTAKAMRIITRKKIPIEEKPTRESKPETSETQTTEKTAKAMRIITRKKPPVEEKPTRKSKPGPSEIKLILERPTLVTKCKHTVQQHWVC
ncbi:uncharacterized protein LOC144683222 [Cetorhinus maximus]